MSQTMRRHTFFPGGSAYSLTSTGYAVQPVGVLLHSAGHLTAASPSHHSPSQPSFYHEPPKPVKRRPIPPRPQLSPLVIPVTASARPVHITHPPPHTHQPPQQHARQQHPQPPRHPAPPQHHPPPVPSTHQQQKQQQQQDSASDEIDSFQYQYPCMLPPSAITLHPPPIGTSSPRYSLPALLPSSQTQTAPAPSLQRSKPYLLSRRERLRGGRSPARRARRVEDRHLAVGDGRDSYDDVSREVLDVVRRPRGSLEEAAGEAWYDVVEHSVAAGRVWEGGEEDEEEGERTPVGAIETPLEYRARQAAALHDLLGLVLGEETPVVVAAAVGGKRKMVHDGRDAVFEEERELAARGFMKVSAEEYLSEVRNVRWIAFGA
ncbi:hypothetical protein B0H67DRAFT_549625 [Lasiosphaeris hirsuta]|uniref:Uncharacterized protein n=1 Tax=Lasiosphaeris hirsuta TaxID=260670 RepID=A0AA40BD12_9PEZI|nr:hypothetical protein B0H67DRAFT_549625 [Lasiosphaeris hirsuta]